MKGFTYPDLLHLKSVATLVEKMYNSKTFSLHFILPLTEGECLALAAFSALARYPEKKGRAFFGEVHKKPVAYFDALWRFLQSGAADGQIGRLEKP